MFTPERNSLRIFCAHTTLWTCVASCALLSHRLLWKQFVFTWRNSHTGSHSCRYEDTRFCSAIRMTLCQCEHIFMPASCKHLSLRRKRNCASVTSCWFCVKAGFHLGNFPQDRNGQESSFVLEPLVLTESSQDKGNFPQDRNGQESFLCVKVSYPFQSWGKLSWVETSLYTIVNHITVKKYCSVLYCRP